MKFQNLKFQAIEGIMKEIFKFREVLLYQIIKKSDFQISSLHHIFNGTESMKFPAPIFSLV